MPPKGRRRNQDNQNLANQAAPAQVAVTGNEREELLKELDEIGDVFAIQVPERIDAAASGGSLLITHVDIVDFKSYSGKQTIGPFHEKLSGIIGPNGSGKSNVIDSLLFVFGFRSNKIRATKLSSFIHNSAGRTADSCSVVVNFQRYLKEVGTGHITVTERFSIGRTVDQANKSKYTMDGRTVQFKEVAAKLRACGVDLDHNRFLILQGEVEQISLMKPKGEREGDEGMLEYLDDIIGTNRYDKPVKLLALKYELVVGKRETQMNRVNAVEMDKSNMTEPVRELLELLVLENRISAAKNKLFSFNGVEYRKRLETLNEEKTEKSQAIDAKKAELEEITAKIRESKKVASKHQKQLDHQKSALANTEKRLNDENLRKQKIELGYQKTKVRQQDKEKEIAKEEKKITTLAGRPDQNNAEIEQLRAELETVKEQLDDKQPRLAEALNTCQHQTESLNVDRNKIGEKLAAAQKSEDEANAALTLAQSKKIAITEQAENFESRLSTAKRELDEANELIVTRKREKESVSNVAPRVQQEVNDLKVQLADVVKQEPDAINDVNKLQQQYNAASADVNTDRRNRQVVTMLMREKHNGNIPGVIGRLGSLGAIDPKYDIAVSTTCSGLDMIVCDTTETIKKCLRYIEENGCDRTSFIALDKLGHFQRDMEPIKTPDNHPRVFDLIKCKDEIRPAFYHCLKNTIVVDDINTANKVAASGQRFRIITLGGGVIELSGTLTGGGNAIRRGRIGTNVQAIQGENPADILPRLTQAKQVLDEIRGNKARLEASIEAKTREINQSTVNLRRIEQQVEILESRIKANQNVVEEMTKRIAENKIDDAELERANTEIDELERKRNELTSVADSVKRDYDAISRRIDAVYEESSGELQRDVNALTERQTEIEAKVKSLRTAATKAEVDLAKSKEKIQNMHRALEEMSRELEGLDESKRKVEEDISELAELINEQKARVQELEILVNEATDGSGENDAKEVALKKEIAGANEALTAVAAKIHSLEGKLADMQTKASKLKVYNIKEILAEKSLKRAQEKKRRIGNRDGPPKSKSMRANDDDDDDSVLSDTDTEEEDAAPAAAAATTSAEDPETAFDPNDPNCGVLPTFELDQILAMNRDEIEFELADAERERQGLTVAMNLNLIESYRQKLHELRQEWAKLRELSNERDRVRDRLNEFKRLRVVEFMDGFCRISVALQEQYQMLTLGGDANLELADPMDPYSEGIKFCVRPRGKGWRPMQLTSGGEKTLSSLSLVFALHDFRPTPFYVMDEIDAALDPRNVTIIGHYVKERSEAAQFIIISLREQMFNLSNRLVGIYKVNDCTRHVVVPLREDDDQGCDENNALAIQN